MTFLSLSLRPSARANEVLAAKVLLVYLHQLIALHTQCRVYREGQHCASTMVLAALCSTSQQLLRGLASQI